MKKEEERRKQKKGEEGGRRRRKKKKDPRNMCKTHARPPKYLAMKKCPLED